MFIVNEDFLWYKTGQLLSLDDPTVLRCHKVWLRENRITEKVIETKVLDEPVVEEKTEIVSEEPEHKPVKKDKKKR